MIIIVHYLSRPCKSQFVARNSFDTGRIRFQRVNFFGEFRIVLFQFRNFIMERLILRLHTIILDQSHLAEDERDKEVNSKKS